MLEKMYLYTSYSLCECGGKLSFSVLFKISYLLFSAVVMTVSVLLSVYMIQCVQRCVGQPYGVGSLHLCVGSRG